MMSPKAKAKILFVNPKLADNIAVLSGMVTPHISDPTFTHTALIANIIMFVCLKILSLFYDLNLKRIKWND